MLNRPYCCPETGIRMRCDLGEAGLEDACEIIPVRHS